MAEILLREPLGNGEEMLTYFGPDGHLHTGVAVPEGQYPSEFAIQKRT